MSTTMTLSLNLVKLTILIEVSIVHVEMLLYAPLPREARSRGMCGYSSNGLLRILLPISSTIDSVIQ